MLATVAQTLSKLETPPVDWVALAPILALFCGALVLLLITAVVPQRLPVWVSAGVTVLAAAVSLGFSVHMWNRVSSEGALVTIGGSVVIDGMAIFAFGAMAVSVALCALLLADFVDRDGLEAVEINSLMLLSACGGLIMASANDLLVLFLGVEILSIAVYVLAASYRRKLASSEAGMKYFLLGSFASALLLYGIALAYGATGSFRYDRIATFLAGTVLTSEFLVIAAVGLLIVGLAFKIGAVPFHSWVPDVYQGSPTPVVSYMASVVKIAAFVALLRVLTGAFAAERDRWQLVIGLLAAASLLFGSLLAIVQSDVKRTLAYSSISHVGFMLAGVYVGTAMGSAAVLNYVAVYSLMAIGAFGVISVVSGRGDSATGLDAIEGLGRRNPAVALAMTILLLAQAGVPFTGGFMAKFGVIRAVTEGSYWWLAVLAMLSAVVSAYLYLRIIGAMYFGGGDSDSGSFEPVDTPLASTVAIWACVGGVVLLGVLPGLLSVLAADATIFSPLG